MNDDNLGGLLTTQATDEIIEPQAPDIDRLKKMFREAASAQELARELGFRCRDYYDGEQLDQYTKSKLHKRGQSAGAWNQIRRSVDGVLGLIDQSASDPEAIARNENGEEAATVVTKVLRYAADKTDLEETKRILSESFAIGGTCAALIEVDHANDAKVTPIPFDEFYYDPYSKRLDFLDAQYMIHAKWVDLSTAKRMWPDKASEIVAPSSGAGFGVFGPEEQAGYRNIWWDSDRKRILIANIYYVDRDTGVWNYAILCHSTIFEFGESGFHDDMSQPTCPIVGLSYQIDREGVRYGIIRDMLPIQDKINGLDSRTLHLAVSTQLQVTDQTSVTTDKDTARTEAGKADGVIPLGYEKVATTEMFAGSTAKLNQYIEAIRDMSPSPSVLGRAEGANQSGRARQVAAAAGFTEMARAFARLERLEERIYVQMWFRARQFMTEPKMMRVTADSGVRESLLVNYPIMRPMPVLQPVAGPDGKPVIDPRTGQPAMHPQIDPRTGQPVMQPQQVGVQNQLATMDVEITITTVQQSQTLRQEAIQAMLDFAAKTGVPILSPDFEFVLQLSDIPDKEEILLKYQKLKGDAAQQQQVQQAQQQQAAQQAQAVQAQAAQAKTARDSAQAQRDLAMAEKHANENHEAAFNQAIKQSAIQQAAAYGASPIQLAKLNSELPPV